MGEDPTDSPKLLCCWGTPMFCASFYLFSLYAYKFSDGYGTDIYIYIYIVFEAFVRPHLEKRYHNRVKRVKDYLETIKDFDELIFPQSLFLHFLGPEPSNHVRKNVETKKSKFTRIVIYSSKFNILVLNFYYYYYYYLRNEDHT